jgi:hypothetical protein
VSKAKRLAVATLAAAVALPLAAHAGTFTTLYAFKGGSDGAYPTGPLIYHGGWLYGTDWNYQGGGGNVFKVNPTDGHFKIVYTFNGGADGYAPHSGVTYGNGMLYGTTWYGGGSGCVLNNKVLGCGIIFSIDPKTDAETVNLQLFARPPKRALRSWHFSRSRWDIVCRHAIRRHV